MDQNLSKSKNLKQLIRQTIPTLLMLFAFSTMLYAQNGIHGDCERTTIPGNGD